MVRKVAQGGAAFPCLGGLTNRGSSTGQVGHSSMPTAMIATGLTGVVPVGVTHQLGTYPQIADAAINFDFNVDCCQGTDDDATRSTRRAQRHRGGLG